MPPRCQSDKTFRPLKLWQYICGGSGCHTPLLNDNPAASCFTLIHFQKEGRYYFLSIGLFFLYKQRWYIGLVMGGLNYTASKISRIDKKSNLAQFGSICLRSPGPPLCVCVSRWRWNATDGIEPALQAFAISALYIIFLPRYQCNPKVRVCRL